MSRATALLLLLSLLSGPGLARADSGEPGMEPTAAYTVDGLLSRGLHQSFESGIEFERVTDARASAKLAFLNLTPHFTTGEILSLVPTVAIAGILRVVGDLVPFLMPVRWSRADEAQLDADAERMAAVVVRADAGEVAASLALAALANDEAVQELRRDRIPIVALRDRVREREKTGIYPIGKSDEVTAVLDAMDTSSTDLRDLAANERAALAHAVGFYNPRAVGRIVLPRPSVAAGNGSGTPSDESIRQAAIRVSPELWQLNSLIEAAEANRAGRAFNWIDPNGDPQGGLGLGLPTYIQLGSIRVSELISERARVQALLGEKAAQAADALRKADSDYRVARETSLVEQRNADRILNDISIGISFEMASLVSSLQGRIKARLSMVQAWYQYQASRTQLDRLLMRGAYAEAWSAGGAE